ncbi:hypothetical protein HPB47_013273 [Ixodes persulcatus]|uniref:Uncharacterized protein n=1 Tax=Ixodes persulcatus TaxID=34615 RepID=A0AC60QYW9_IXOPE|nr:hypothetical protein HPB47_013273 [Ixodes persulcatus]
MSKLILLTVTSHFILFSTSQLCFFTTTSQLHNSKEYRLAEFVHEEIPDDLPESFDAREKWSHRDSIHLIRDQSGCGSCWAFGATEAMSDRVCIHSNGKIQVNISAEDLLDCCDTSVVSTTPGCKTSSLASCEHHTKGRFPNCTTIVRTPKCVHRCRKGYGKDYQDDKHFGHAVRILGWDTENGTPYWLVANSWNEDWGDKSYFKILRGQDECGIEEDINAGIPKSE